MRFHNSNVLKILAATFLTILLLIAVQLKQRPRSTGLKKLANEFRIANQAKTVEPMLKLYYLEGSDESSITLLKGALLYELGLAIETIKFEPLRGAPEETIQFIHNGTEYGPTLKPRRRMRVTYKGNDHFTSIYTVGKTKSGDWKFILTKPVLVPVEKNN